MPIANVKPFLLTENQPQGASDRCLDCKFMETCPYSAKRIYIDEYRKDPTKPRFMIKAQCIGEVTEEKIVHSLKTTNYGKCVYKSDNNVVDNQCVMMQFENGVKATFRMTAFTQNGGREIHFHGTLGEIFYNDTKEYIKINVFGKEEETIYYKDLTDDLSGHGGGDKKMVDKLYNIITNKETKNDTSLERSIESHLMCCAAEESRLKGGVQVLVHEE